jgi:enterochelin esterase-like enzyme
MIVRYDTMASQHAAPRSVSVWLPPDYQSSKRRYPVIYMQDGQNLFAHSLAYGGQSWRVDQGLQRANATAIVVGIWNTPRRRQEYAPTAVENLLPLGLRTRTQTEHGGPSLADGYLRFIVQELKPLIDRDYRTRSDRHSTLLMGSSMGALISLYGLCEYPSVFGGAGCLSTHWTLLNAPESYSKPDLETPVVIAAFESYLKTKLPKAGTSKVWMDHGTKNLDGFYGPYQTAMDSSFEALGWRPGRDFISRIYPDGDHNEASWRQRVHEPLGFLLSRPFPSRRI